jgi:methylated-DNA-[protein]-cysteine S-methyltransferase
MQDTETPGEFAEVLWNGAGVLVRIERSDAGISRVHILSAPLSDPVPGTSDPLLEEASVQLRAYFDGRLRQFQLPLDLGGTAFQRSVWQELLEIPYGETRTYAEIAEAIGHPTAVRAVGAANGQNPVAIIVPCHRVIRTGGGLGGYGGGLDAKRALLDLERGMASLPEALDHLDV